VTGLQTFQAALQVGVEPALHAARADDEVLGDRLVCAAALGQQDDLGAVAQAAVRRGPKDLLEKTEFV
jgi:hypothetical protein